MIGFDSQFLIINCIRFAHVYNFHFCFDFIFHFNIFSIPLVIRVREYSILNLNIFIWFEHFWSGSCWSQWFNVTWIHKISWNAKYANMNYYSCKTFECRWGRWFSKDLKNRWMPSFFRRRILLEQPELNQKQTNVFFAFMKVGILIMREENIFLLTFWVEVWTLKITALPILPWLNNIVDYCRFKNKIFPHLSAESRKWFSFSQISIYPHPPTLEVCRKDENRHVKSESECSVSSYHTL